MMVDSRNSQAAKDFINGPAGKSMVVRAVSRTSLMNGPAAGVKKWFEIKAAANNGPAEICIYDRIGYDWWSGEGTEAKVFVEALKEIPMSQAITLRINSPGGNVHDGMLIYNRLAERRDHITVIVDGYAASIASVIALCGKELQMPRNTLFMIHDPWGMVEGNAAEMRKAADMLDKHRDAILSVYENKIDATKDEIISWMSAETWFTGDEAKTAGFADTITDEISFQACAETLSAFKRVPEQLKTKDKSMNRKKIEARLKKLGLTFNATATDAELQAMLKAEEKRINDLKLANEGETESVSSEEPAAELETEIENEPSTPARRVQNRVDPAMARMQAQLDSISADRDNDRKQLAKERKSRIEAVIDQCIENDQIPAPQREKWVTRAIADETVLDDIREMPSRPPGFAPVSATITSESPKDVERGIVALRAPLNSWLKGNSMDMKTISANAMAIAVNIQNHRKKLDQILNTNTIDTNLKRNVIMSDLMREFKRRLLMLNVFSTTYTNVPLEGTNKIIVPFYDLDTTSSTEFVAATGYTFSEDTTVGSRELTVNRRKYKSMNFTSETFRRQPYFQPSIALGLKAEQLALDVWLDILSIVKADPYGASAFDAEASTFDSDDMVALRKIANDADWPDVGRAAVLGTSHEAALLTDDAIKHLQNSGSTDALREGSTGKLSGFDMFYSPRIPTNSEDLAGFICLPQAAIVATAPIAPAPGVRSLLLSYDLVIDPQTGIAFEYRYYGDPQIDKDRETVECNYGFAKGNDAALKRITAGSAEFSSSSSASSVNSSSSSSSSASF